MIEGFLKKLAIGKRSVARPRLFENSHGLNRPQRRLFALDALGEGGWLKALRLEGHAPRPPRRPPALQEANLRLMARSRPSGDRPSSGWVW